MSARSRIKSLFVRLTPHERISTSSKCMRIGRAPAHRSRGVTAYFASWKEHEKRTFNFVIVEALDRLSRDMEDLAGIHKRLSFLGIEIRAVHEGVVNTVLVGLRGLVGQLYREDNAHKIRRGQAGRVGQGLNAGGLTYGYASCSR